MGYRPIDRITVQHEGLPIHLKLQERLEVPPVPFYCVTWRTVYARGRSNRRFYRSRRTGFWTIPVRLASDLMRCAEGRGWLDVRYDDLQVRHRGTGNTIIDSRELGVRERRFIFESITSTQGEPDWGDDPLFIVIQVPDGTWRKIMIVDAARDLCTFRSTTTDVGYMPVIADPHLNPWRMDNAMQDASTAMTRMFLNVLDAET